MLPHCPIASILWQEFIFFYVWCGLGNAFFDEGNFVKLAWLFRGQEAEKSLEGSSSVPFLDALDRKKQKSF